MSQDRFSVNGFGGNNRKLTLSERDEQADHALAPRYDALNQQFIEAEKRLKALKPPHPVWVDYNHQYGDGHPDSWELLGLCRYQGSWRLCHAHDDEQNVNGPMYDIKPVVECPADDRVRAVKAVRKLREKITATKEEYVPKVDEAIRELTDLCQEL